MTFVIESRGTQGNNSRVIIPATGEIATFGTRAAAREHIREITPMQPSKYLPLVVVQVEILNSHR